MWELIDLTFRFVVEVITRAVATFRLPKVKEVNESNEDINI